MLNSPTLIALSMLYLFYSTSLSLILIDKVASFAGIAAFNPFMIL